MVAKNAKILGRPGQKIKEKTKMTVFELSGHLLSRYIMHLGLKNTPGLIFEVPGPQNPIKKLILKVFWKIRRRIFLAPPPQNRHAHILQLHNDRRPRGLLSVSHLGPP